MFGIDSNQSQNQNGYNDIPGGQFVTSPNAHPYQGSFMTPQLPQTQHQPTGSFPQQTYQTQLPNAQQPPQQFAQPPVQQQHQTVAAPEPVKQKPPLPEEYIYMQTVFNELRTQCSNATANPVSLNTYTYTF